MNKLEIFLEEIKELSDLDTCNDAHEMQDRLERIHDLVTDFEDTIFDIPNEIEE